MRMIFQLFGIFVLAQIHRSSSALTTFGIPTITEAPITTEVAITTEATPTSAKVIASIRENEYQLLQGDDPPRYYDTPLELLQSANNSIEKVIIDGLAFYDHELDEISEQIVEFCANSLIEIHLMDVDSFLISGTEEIFPNVVHVHLEYELLPDIQEIHRVYPALEELTIDTQYLHLNSAQVALLLPFIPQLRKLDISFPVNSILQAIQANLPNLRWLSISYDLTMPISRPVHFEGVRTLGLRIEHFTDGVPTAVPFTFVRLETLELKASRIDDKLTEWIRKNNDLKTVTLEDVVDVESMSRLAAALDQLPKLQHVSLTIFGKTDLTGILAHHLGQVESVTLLLHDNFRDTSKQVLIALPKHWKVVDDWRLKGWQQALVIAPVPNEEEPVHFDERSGSNGSPLKHSFCSMLPFLLLSRASMLF